MNAPMKIRMGADNQDITQLLNEISNGSEKAYAKLFPIVYDTLRGLAYRQIVHESIVCNLSPINNLRCNGITS